MRLCGYENREMTQLYVVGELVQVYSAPFILLHLFFKEFIDL